MGETTGATLISLLVPGGASTSGNEPISGGTGFVDALASLGITLSRYGAAMPCQPMVNVVCGEGQPMPQTRTGVSLTPADLSDSQPSITLSIATSTPRVTLPDRIVPSVSSITSPKLMPV